MSFIFDLFEQTGSTIFSIWAYATKTNRGGRRGLTKQVSDERVFCEAHCCVSVRVINRLGGTPPYPRVLSCIGTMAMWFCGRLFEQCVAVLFRLTLKP